MSRVVIPYAMVVAIIVCVTAGFGMMAGLRGWQITLWAIGLSLVIVAILFTFFEVRRIAGLSRSSAEIALEEEEADRDTHHVVVVQSPTGEATPHHEYHPECAGLDQGQLTSRIPGSTPILGDLFERER